MNILAVIVIIIGQILILRRYLRCGWTLVNMFKSSVQNSMLNIVSENKWDHSDRLNGKQWWRITFASLLNRTDKSSNLTNKSKGPGSLQSCGNYFLNFILLISTSLELTNMFISYVTKGTVHELTSQCRFCAVLYAQKGLL